MSVLQEEKFKVCKWWLARGFALLPIQPNSKYLFAGYGEHQKKITTTEQAAEIIRKFPLANLAVLGHGGMIILDFDSPELYKLWCDRHPEYKDTYTEKTPGRDGAHVFAFGHVPSGLKLVPGVEIKKRCVVYPSVIDGKQYTRGAGEIIEASTEIFSSLSIPGTPTASLLNRIERSQAVRQQQSGTSLVEQIKADNDLLHVFSVYVPDIKFEIKGNIATACCPFHKDKKPSLFVLIEKGYYKCHACGEHGDVINLYAWGEGIDNREAVARLTRKLQAVR
jgi:DNA primase